MQEKIKMLKETRLVVASVTGICVDFRSASVVDWRPSRWWQHEIGGGSILHGDCDWRYSTQGEHYVMIGDLVFHTFLHVSSFTRPMVESAVSNLCLAGMSSGFFVQPFSNYFHVVFWWITTLLRIWSDCGASQCPRYIDDRCTNFWWCCLGLASIQSYHAQYGSTYNMKHGSLPRHWQTLVLKPRCLAWRQFTPCVGGSCRSLLQLDPLSGDDRWQVKGKEGTNQITETSTKNAIFIKGVFGLCFHVFIMFSPCHLRMKLMSLHVTVCYVV